MKTAQRETAIDCYYNKVIPNIATSQNERVMSAVCDKFDYSLSELMQIVNVNPHLPKIDKSSMSRVVNGLRACGRLIVGTDRKCSVTGVTITPSKLPTKQGDLFL